MTFILIKFARSILLDIRKKEFDQSESQEKIHEKVFGNPYYPGAERFQESGFTLVK